MKKMILFLLIVALFTGCYTTFYPNVAQQVDGIENVPDSTRQIIINNYYESNEYYQVPRYQRYSLLWGDYYWDPFYYNYGYYHWEPYYWYGRYYYYNPRSHYWYYYHHYPYYYSGGGSGGNEGSHERDRIRKPGYEPLMNAPATSTAPFISVGIENDIISRPDKRSDVGINSGIGGTPASSSSPRIESVGKVSDKSGGDTHKSNDNSIYKPSGRSNSNSKSSSTTVSTPKSSRQSQPAIQKPASSTSSNNKKSSSESSTTNEKK
ncbi:MAG: hypothetical protein WC372_00120 [Candidatus Neomarinimicrobiota bacterium]|jgi:hypothetical protein|nr:hypothetical protein [Candidatus Neomarinimicrobiota bacterium]MDX9779792.1 hypothetical protein [bacterium]